MGEGEGPSSCEGGLRARLESDPPMDGVVAMLPFVLSQWYLCFPVVRYIGGCS